MERFWPTAIKIALEVALLYFEGLPKLMIDYHVYDLAYGSYSTLPLEKYQQQQHLGFCNWTNTFEVAFAMQCIAVQFFLRIRDTFKKYILQTNWVKTAIPVLNSGQSNLQTPMWGCHRQHWKEGEPPNGILSVTGAFDAFP